MPWWLLLTLIILICIAGICWFSIVYIYGINEQDGKDTNQYLQSELKSSISAQVNINKIAEIISQIELLFKELLFFQSVFMPILIVLQFLTVELWLVQHRGGYFFGMIMGAITIGILAFFAMKQFPKTIAKCLIKGQQTKEDLFSFVYDSGFALISLLIAVVYGQFILFYIVCKFSIDEMDEEAVQKLSQISFGFVMGMILSAFIYRETASVLARSLKTCTQGLVISDQSLDLDQPSPSIATKIIFIISNQFGEVVVNFIDGAVILVFLLVAGFFLLTHSPEILESELIEVALLGPGFLVLANYLGSIISFFFRVIFSEEEASAFAALNIRWQILFSSIASFFIYLILPFELVVDEFTLANEETEAINSEGKGIAAACWCCLLGLILNVVHICLFEWFTSHACPQVKNLVNYFYKQLLNKSHSSSNRVKLMNIIFSSYFGEVFAFIPFFLVISFIIVAYALMKFAGILFLACGFVGLIIITMTIYFIGSVFSNSARLVQLSQFNQNVYSHIYYFSWSTKNYKVYLKMTNSDKAAVIIGFALVGGIMYSTETQSLGPMGIFGASIGFFLIYLIKGINSCAIINVSKDYKTNVNSESGVYDIVVELIIQKFMQCSKYVLFNLLIVQKKNQYSYVFRSLQLSFFVELFLELKASWDYQLVLLLEDPILVIVVLLKELLQRMLKYITKVINELFDQIEIIDQSPDSQNQFNFDMKKKLYIFYSSADTFGYATEETNAAPLFIYGLYIVILIVSCHQFFNHQSYTSILENFYPKYTLPSFRSSSEIDE